MDQGVDLGTAGWVGERTAHPLHVALDHSLMEQGVAAHTLPGTHWLLPSLLTALHCLSQGVFFGKVSCGAEWGGRGGGGGGDETRRSGAGDGGEAWS